MYHFPPVFAYLPIFISNPLVSFLLILIIPDSYKAGIVQGCKGVGHSLALAMQKIVVLKTKVSIRCIITISKSETIAGYFDKKNRLCLQTSRALSFKLTIDFILMQM